MRKTSKNLSSSTHLSARDMVRLTCSNIGQQMVQMYLNLMRFGECTCVIKLWSWQSFSSCEPFLCLAIYHVYYIFGASNFVSCFWGLNLPNLELKSWWKVLWKCYLFRACLLIIRFIFLYEMSPPLNFWCFFCLI